MTLYVYGNEYHERNAKKELTKLSKEYNERQEKYAKKIRRVISDDSNGI
jgi:hypothetical protein